MYLEGITTDRLLFRKLTTSDISIWEEFCNDKENRPYLGFDQTTPSNELSAKWITKQLWRYDHNQFGHHALINKNTHEFIGQAGLLTQKVNDKEEIEIGYHIIPRFRNFHYATEAAEKVRDYAFENNICLSLISIIHVKNDASQRVAKNIGMKKDQKVISFTRDIQRFGDFYIYRVLKKDWIKKENE